MDYNRIKISLDQAKKILLDLYRIEGEDFMKNF